MSQICDHFPEYCLPFSPNWYMPQIASIEKEKNYLAFGVNNFIFLMNYAKKYPITNFVCDLKSMNLKMNIEEKNAKKQENMHENKITSVLLYNQFVIAGLENSYIYIFKFNEEKKENLLFSAKKYDFCKQIIFFAPLQTQNNLHKILCVDSKGTCLILTFNDNEILNEELRKISNNEENNEADYEKLVYFKRVFQSYFLFVYNSGKIQIISQNFEYTLEEIKLNKKILSFDAIENQLQAIKILCVVKIHSKISILSTFISKTDLDYLYEQKKNQSNAIVSENEEIIQDKTIKLASIQSEIKLDFHLADSYIHNKEEVKQASLTIKWLNEQEFLISGKMGEIYLLNIKVFEEKTKIKFSPLSNESETKENFYYTVPDNPHYKSIYSFYLIESNDESKLSFYVSIGLDRRIVFWSFLKNQILNSFKFDWKINCLGGKVSCITHSLKEKNLVVFGSSDHTIKLWDLEKKNNKFFTIDIWRNLKEYEIKNIKVSNYIPEIIYIQAGDNSFLIYNAYSQNLLYSLKTSMTIVFFEEIPIEFYDYFHKNFKFIPNFDKNIETKAHLKKKTENESLNHFSLILCKQEINPNNNEQKFIFILYDYISCKTESFETDFSNITSMNLKTLKTANIFLLLMGLGDYFGSINLLGTFNNSHVKELNEKELLSFSKKIEKIHNYKINCLDFSIIPNKELVLLATGSNDRRLVVSSILIFPGQIEEKIMEFQTLYKFTHKVQILSLCWAMNFRKLLCLGVNHHTVQVFDFSRYDENNQNQEEKKNSDEFEICNIRGHSGYIVAADFFADDPNLIVSASDDQTLKVWDLHKIENKKPPNKKKKSKKNK